MFRPFLPCGIAYGFAHALPMALPMLCLWHSMLFFRRKASRRVVCIVPYRRGACQPVSAEFRRHLPFSGAGGCPRVGGIAPALQARRALTAPYGGRAFFVACLPCLWFLILPPIPPARARRALFPGGEGGDQSYFMQGAPPLASPRLSPGGTYRTSQAGARSGALPLARRGWRFDTRRGRGS